MDSLTHAVIGLPGSGKTTFLAALWHLITSGETQSDLVLADLTGNRTYLNQIAGLWQRCENVPRTPTASVMNVSLHVRDSRDEKKFILNFSDISGESFKTQFCSRYCTNRYVDSHSSHGGILLFINPDKYKNSHTIQDVGAELLDGEESQDPPRKEWSADMAPDQVQLVEIIQFLLRPPFVRRLRKIAIMISAWDVITEPDISPEGWFQRECPFLYHFLCNNPEHFAFKVYGISAQGGDFSKEDIKKSLSLTTPSERIKCIEQKNFSHDITLPLLWLNECT